MTLINLKQIEELVDRSRTDSLITLSSSYNVDPKEEVTLPDSTFVILIKTHRQARSIYTQLNKVRTVCADFSSGNFQPYIDDHNKWADSEHEPYNPLETLSLCFDSSSILDLPRRIEQYAELVALANRYSTGERVLRKSLEDFLGVTFKQLTVDDNGEPTLVPMNEEAEIKQEFKEIDVDFCLDHYNTFYDRCMELINNPDLDASDAQNSVWEILQMFAPRKERPSSSRREGFGLFD